MIEIFHLLITGVTIGFLLGLTGGGGSIMAVPLLSLYVGVSPPHIAFGTAAVAVAASALLNLMLYARGKLVQWQAGFIFAGLGVIGAYFGSSLGQKIDGHKLLQAFGFVMIIVGLLSLKNRKDTQHTKSFASIRLALGGLIIGFLSGFFGIGGGFLIVPMLVFASGMAFTKAIATSLIAVFLFGLTTALNYAAAGLVNWKIAAFIIVFGFIGGLIGKHFNHRLGQSMALIKIFAALCISAGLYVIFKA